MADVPTILKDYGLTDNEIKTYILLVGSNKLTAYEIAKKTKIHRSTVYDLLDRLIEKGFVTSISMEKARYYIANELSNIIFTLKEKESMLLSIIPKLEQLKQKIEVKVHLSEGGEATRADDYAIYNLIKSGEVNDLYIMGIAPASTAGSEAFIGQLIKEALPFVKKHKLKYRGLVDKKYRGTYTEKRYAVLGENRFLKEMPEEATTVICGDYMFLFFSSDKPYGIMIKNKLVADEFKFYFDQVWKSAKK